MERTRAHNLIDLVTIAICAAICGADAWTDVERFGRAKLDWFSRFLELPNGIPSHDTFGRVFARLDTAEFFNCLQSWVQSLNVATEGKVIAIDGKTLRGSFDAAANKSALHMVNAWATEAGVVLGQVATAEKSNEITAIPELLELIDVAGGIVTIDAMGCQKAIAAKIRDGQADYVLAVKDNHPTLHAELEELFAGYGEDDFSASEVRHYQSHSRGHGREEWRDHYVAPAPKDLYERDQWRGIRSVGMVVRRRMIKNVESVEISYYISSLRPAARRFANSVRAHWSVENALHWCLDVTFSEDKSRVRKGVAPEVAGVFRRLALSILKQDTSIKENVRGKRLMAGWDERVLAKILTGYQGK